MSTTEYAEVAASEVPQSIVWITPDRGRGQIVETSYSTGRPAGLGGNYDADHGDRWMRVTDHSDGSTSYYRLARA